MRTSSTRILQQRKNWMNERCWEMIKSMFIASCALWAQIGSLKYSTHCSCATCWRWTAEETASTSSIGTSGSATCTNAPSHSLSRIESSWHTSTYVYVDHFTLFLFIFYLCCVTASLTYVPSFFSARAIASPHCLRLVAIKRLLSIFMHTSNMKQ